MASLSKHHSSGKPKLERRNARKISDYEPSDSPRGEVAPSSFRTLDKGSSKSFRVVGLDSQREIERICRELGLAGGADAFSIPQDAWDAGRARSNSLDRFLEPQPRSKSLDEPAGGIFGRGGSEFARSPLGGTGSLGPSPFYNSMTSSSGDSMASDSSFITGEKGPFGSLDTPTESGPVISEPRQRDDHQQPGNAIQHAFDYDMPETKNLDYHKQTGNVAHEPSIRGMRHLHDGETRADTVLPMGRNQGSQDTQVPVDHKGTQNVTHTGSTHEMRPPDSRQTGNEMERVPRLIVERNPQILQPPPGMRSKSYISDLSTHELLKSFGPDENDHENRASDRDDATSSDSEDSVADVVDDEAREEFEGFVSNVVQQNGVSAQEDTPIEDIWSPASSTPGRSPNLIRIQSWRKLEMLGSGSFGTVYEGMSEDGVYFAVKEVSLSENDSRAQQCVTQLEQEIEFLSKFRHENIVQYLGTQKEPDKLYIFLELVTKGSLSSLYQKYTLFESQIRSYTRQILSGLMYLHERKVMHRDIKCANILVDVTGKIKVADFGLAKQISQLDEAKSCKGSAYWMAPEVINPRKTYSFPADIWSLGCTVLEMETRRPPFADMEWSRVLWKVGHGEAPAIPDNLSEDAKDFIKQCLEVNPAKRPSARKLLEHPFVRYAGTGLTPRNSFTEDLSAELPVIAEDKTL